MPFIEKFSHGACISEWRFFPIKSIQFNSRIYKSNRLQQFHFIKCAQIQVSVRETKWRRAAPGCVTSEAEHKWCLRGCMRPSDRKISRMCGYLSLVSVLSLARVGLSDYHHQQAGGNILMDILGNWGIIVIHDLKKIGSILDSSDFFALRHFRTLKSVWNMRSLTGPL